MGIIRPIRHKTDLLQALGLVSVFHSTLQYELAEVLKELLQIDRRHARFLMSQVSFRVACSTIKGLATERIVDPALLEELNRLLGRAEPADGNRNRLMHSDWGVSLGLLFSEEAVRSKPKKEDLDHHEVIGPETVSEVADDICALADAFANFWPRLRGHLRRSAPRPPEQLTFHPRQARHAAFLEHLEPAPSMSNWNDRVGISSTPRKDAHEFVLATADALVGYIALTPEKNEKDRWFLSCVIASNMRGRGLATEACTSLIRWARENHLAVIAEPLDKPESKGLVRRLEELGALRPTPEVPHRWCGA